MEFLNLAIISALIPLNVGLVQYFKTDSWPTWVTRMFSLTCGMVLAYTTRMAGIEGISATLANPYFCALTGVAVAVGSSAGFDMIKSGIVSKIAKSESTVTVPSELVDADKTDPASTMNVAPATPVPLPSVPVEEFPPVVPKDE